MCILLGVVTTKKQIFSTEKAPRPIGPYSQAIIYNDLLFVSGQGPIDPVTNKVVDNTIERQTRQILNNIKTIITEAGFSMENALKVTVFLKNINDFTAFNEVYEEFFTSSLPTRVCIQAGKLPAGWKAEVDAIVGKEA